MGRSHAFDWEWTVETGTYHRGTNGVLITRRSASGERILRATSTGVLMRFSHSGRLPPNRPSIFEFFMATNFLLTAPINGIFVWDFFGAESPNREVPGIRVNWQNKCFSKGFSDFPQLIIIITAVLVNPRRFLRSWIVRMEVFMYAFRINYNTFAQGDGYYKIFNRDENGRRSPCCFSGDLAPLEFTFGSHRFPYDSLVIFLVQYFSKEKASMTCTLVWKYSLAFVRSHFKCAWVNPPSFKSSYSGAS